MRLWLLTLSWMLLTPALCDLRGCGETSEASARSAPTSAATVAPKTWHERWVAKTYGASTLAQLQRMGTSAKVFWYANRNAAAGVKRLAKGKHADGFYLLNKAYGLIKSPNILYHLAQANEAIGRLLRAREQYASFLATAPRWTLTPVSAAAQQTARKRLLRLERRLVPLRLTVNVKGALLFLNGRLRGKSPFNKRFWIRPGRTVRLVLLRAGHRRVEKALSYKRGGAQQSLKLVMLTHAEAVRRHRRFQELKRRKAEVERKRRKIQQRLDQERRARLQRSIRRQRRYRLAGWIGLATGSAAILAGGLFAILGEREFNNTIRVTVDTPWNDVKTHFKRSTAYRTTAYASMGSGAAFVVAGAILLYLGYRPLSLPGDKSAHARTSPWDRLKLTPQLGPKGVGLTASWSL